MTLHIHFGIYKAGSSYIQYICANQREYLVKNKIYFPESAEDKKMKAGLISKGNADGLDAALKKDDAKKISTLFKTWLEQAQAHNCKAVLISAEALVHQLAIQKRLELLTKTAKDVGYKSIKAMGFFRDLADHALSTYKHRAKSGKHPDYEYWIRHNYETPKLLIDLSQTIKNNQDITWSLRKFQKNSNFLKQAFFKDWLKVETPVFKEQPTVNESLTLSEVKVMNHLKKAYPMVLDYFINDFKALSKSKKAKDIALENYVLNTFLKTLQQHKNSIDQINNFFSMEEQLVIETFNNRAYDEPSIQLSDAQLETLTKRLTFFKVWRGKKIIISKRILRFIR